MSGMENLNQAIKEAEEQRDLREARKLENDKNEKEMAEIQNVYTKLVKCLDISVADIDEYETKYTAYVRDIVDGLSTDNLWNIYKRIINRLHEKSILENIAQQRIDENQTLKNDLFHEVCDLENKRKILHDVIDESILQKQKAIDTAKSMLISS